MLNNCLAYENGTPSLLLHLVGTLPVSFRGNSYNIPIDTWIPSTYPLEAPIVYVTPTPDMVVRSGQHVTLEGRVYHHYLAHWHETWDVSSTDVARCYRQDANLPSDLRLSNCSQYYEISFPKSPPSKVALKDQHNPKPRDRVLHRSLRFLQSFPRLLERSKYLPHNINQHLQGRLSSLQSRARQRQYILRLQHIHPDQRFLHYRQSRRMATIKNGRLL